MKLPKFWKHKEVRREQLPTMTDEEWEEVGKAWSLFNKEIAILYLENIRISNRLKETIEQAEPIKRPKIEA